MKTIVQTSITNYTFDVLDDTAIDACPNVFHLRLTPKSDPAIFRLRELWIDKATRRICHAKADERFRLNTMETVSTDLYVDPQTGLVTRFSFDGYGKRFGQPLHVGLDVRMTEYGPADITDDVFQGKH